MSGIKALKIGDLVLQRPVKELAEHRYERFRRM